MRAKSIAFWALWDMDAIWPLGMFFLALVNDISSCLWMQLYCQVIIFDENNVRLCCCTQRWTRFWGRAKLCSMMYLKSPDPSFVVHEVAQRVILQNVATICETNLGSTMKSVLSYTCSFIWRSGPLSKKSPQVLCETKAIMYRVYVCLSVVGPRTLSFQNVGLVLLATKSKALVTFNVLDLVTRALVVLMKQSFTFYHTSRNLVLNVCIEWY